MRKVGIVMPSINLWDKYTKPAIHSVVSAVIEAAIKDVQCEFLLIDNASTDNTQREAEILRSSLDLRYLRNEEMWGFQRSVNFGVNKFFNEEEMDYVLVLNNDIVLHKNVIWRLVERFEKGNVGMVTCLDVTGECERDPANLPRVDDNEKAENCLETPHPCFSAFMINRECWEKIGEFDEIFHPAYYEDNDYHYRMQLADLPAITYPPAMFFHWGSATQLEALGRPLTDSANQHAQYVRKWGGNPGHEKFKTPYDTNEPITSTKQQKSV